ncbi:hypothetical protein D3C77_605190 [compost metagenome]
MAGLCPSRIALKANNGIKKITTSIIIRSKLLAAPTYCSGKPIVTSTLAILNIVSARSIFLASFLPSSDLVHSIRNIARQIYMIILSLTVHSIFIGSQTRSNLSSSDKTERMAKKIVAAKNSSSLLRCPKANKIHAYMPCSRSTIHTIICISSENKISCTIADIVPNCTD